MRTRAAPVNATIAAVRCPVVIGRDPELTLIADAVDAAAAGRGSCVLVTGEAGVGKSRLVAEAADAAASRGHAVLVGRSTETDRTSPMRPLAEALLGALRDRPAPADPSLQPFIPALGTLVPHWADPERAFAAVPPSPVVLAEAVLRALHLVAGDSAGVLVVEDLHWADRETLTVLEYLAHHVREFPLLLLLTLRSGEPGTRPVEVALPTASRLPLVPLSDDEVAAMAAACLGVPVAPEERLRRLRPAGGLPLAVEDLVAADVPGTSSRYAELVRERLSRLGPAARAVVLAAAVLGEDVDPRLVAPTCGCSDEEVDRLLDVAVDAQLLVVGNGRHAFRHALTRDAVLSGMPPADGVRLARAAATALEASSERDAPSGRLGELWAQAGDGRRAAEALRRAARGAVGSGASATAEVLLRRALTLAPAGVSDGLRLDLLELLAVTGRVEELTVEGGRALDDLAYDDQLVAEVHLLLARAAVGGGAPADARSHLEALPSPGRLGVRTLARLRILQGIVAMAGGAADRLPVSRHLAEQAVALADRAGDPPLACEALELLAAATRARDLGAAAEVLRRELAVAQRAGLTLWRLRALNELGTVEVLRDARGDRLERALDLALRIGAVDIAASVAVNLAALHAMTGALGRACAVAAQARGLAAPLGAVGASAAATAIEGVAHGFAGRRSESERLLRAALELAPDDADLAAFVWSVGRGLTALLHEERADARAALVRAQRLAAPIRTLDPASGPLLLLRAVDGEDVRAEVGAERSSATVGARWAAAWPAYAEAVALSRDGEMGAAEAAFADAETAAERYPLFRALARRLVAEATLARPFGDPVTWLREAEAEFLGRRLHRSAAACRRMLSRAGAPVPRRRGRDVELPGPLLRLGVTAREAEVLELVAERLSNRDIAAQLFLSPRTVEKHVASLLMKTNAADRTALTRLARTL